jgi:hypothetical protein
VGALHFVQGRVRLAAQGPLGATYFQGIEYDVDADGFKPTTVRQLIPTFEAIFAALVLVGMALGTKWRQSASGTFGKSRRFDQLGESGSRWGTRGTLDQKKAVGSDA